MSTAADATVILLQLDPIQEKLIATALQSMSLRVRKISVIDPIDSQLKMLTSGNAKNRPLLICADLARLAKENLSWTAFCKQIKSQIPHAGLIATNSQMMLPQAQTVQWVKQAGGLELIGRLSSRRYVASVTPLMDCVAKLFDLQYSAVQLKSYASGMLVSEDPTKDPRDSEQQAWALLDEMNISPAQLMAKMAASNPQIPVANRRYRLKLYQQCFLGSEAANWLAGYLRISVDQAVDVGNLLLHCRLIDHVTREKPFDKNGWFYRYQSVSHATAKLDFTLLAKEIEEIFQLQDRHWRGLSFMRCFTGDQAVTALVRHCAITESEALWVGQQLQDLYLYRHVEDEHDFKNQSYFYRLILDAKVSL
ncbi:hypothetical protein [Pelagibaculum spongiae]|uniref:DEP domain-containing protein n=1 Tax=Pelagibaculum spongiae TaxID=2080658 RepID=A0A2V1GS20_9GAMM|nr:hypothetical protein [Pelagibaculum spongiae]PVZ68189.1 hypothetical protein DC094_12885 [Pelagibaculum spongiae]